MSAQPTFTESLSGELIAIRSRVVTNEDRRQAVLCLLDTFACGLAAANAPMIDRLVNSEVHGPNLVLGRTPVDDLETAILANAAAIRHFDFNDVYSNRNNLHPSEIVVPLVLAHSQGWTGADLIDAITRGYAMNLWIGEAWEGLLDRGWAPTATTGVLAAAAISCDMLDLNPSQTAHALSLASITAPSLGVVFRGEISDAKSIINGLAVLTGLRAADLAARGITGPANAFEGPSGFNEMVGHPAPSNEFESWSQLGPGSVWRKKYPIVFHAHAAVEAAVRSSRRLKMGREVDRVVVRVSKKVVDVAAGPDRWSPATPEDAQFSLPFCVAVALVTGELTPSQLSVEYLSDDRVLNLMSRIEVLPTAQWQTYVGASVELWTGAKRCEETVEIPTGHPNAPMNETEIISKARSLISRWDPDRVDDVIQAIMSIDGPTSIEYLLDATTGAVG